MTKARRGGKVFLDWSQNSGSKTTISPYSLRGRERPWVATPVGWDEVEAGAEDPMGLEQFRLRRGAGPGRGVRRPVRLLTVTKRWVRCCPAVECALLR